MNLVETLGALHVFSYLLARLGNVEQVRKILVRKREVQQKTAVATAEMSSWTRNISEWYRGLTALVFLTMILWGLSLEKIDWFVSSTRTFALVCFFAVLRERYIDKRTRLAGFFLVSTAALTLLASIVMLVDWGWFKSLSPIFSVLTTCCVLPMLVGIGHKTYVIYATKHVGEQSGWEILTQLFKDVTGIAYGLAVGFDVAWPLIVLLCSTFAARIVNALAFLRYRRRSID